MKKEKKDSGHEDLRQRRTKRHLTDALLELMEERSFSDLSVVDICERAMVHRTTFYAHFNDKAELLRYALRDSQRELEDTIRRTGKIKDAKTYLLELFQVTMAFVRRHQKVFQIGFFSAGGMERQMLEDLIAEQLMQQIGSLNLVPPEDSGFNLDLTAYFYAGAMLSLIRWMINNENPVSDEVLCAHLERFIPLPYSTMEGGTERGRG